MGLCSSTPTKEDSDETHFNPNQNADDDMVANPTHRPSLTPSGTSASRKKFTRKDTITNAPSRLVPAKKPHNKQFPMIGQLRIDNVNDYYTPCTLSKNRVPQHIQCKIDEAPPAAVLGVGAGNNRSAKHLWAFLRPRLRMMVTMNQEWGHLRDMYGHSQSIFIDAPIHR